MKRYIHLFAPLALILLTIGFGVVVTLGGISFFLPPLTVRSLAQIYLETTFNINFNISPLVPEAVTAIVWDYRGLDTLFETSVMFLAIVGALMVFRGLSEELLIHQRFSEGGLSIIVKTVTRLVIVMIIAVGASLALHGHLTPGGGFQGGATIAIAPMIMITTFSVHFLAKRLAIKKAVLIRSIGLAMIAITAYIVLIIALTEGGYAYIFQNQAKIGSPYSIPSYVGGTTVLGGTLLLFNLAETLAVAFGFMVLFILITIPETLAREVVCKGEE
ncbi:MAG: MnhB domain-containing protein [Ignisphaera sp.]